MPFPWLPVAGTLADHTYCAECHHRRCPASSARYRWHLDGDAVKPFAKAASEIIAVDGRVLHHIQDGHAFACRMLSEELAKYQAGGGGDHQTATASRELLDVLRTVDVLTCAGMAAGLALLRDQHADIFRGDPDAFGFERVHHWRSLTPLSAGWRWDRRGKHVRGLRDIDDVAALQMAQVLESLYRKAAVACLRAERLETAAVRTALQQEPVSRA